MYCYTGAMKWPTESQRLPRWLRPAAEGAPETAEEPPPDGRNAPAASQLGRLETRVMALLWRQGEASVQDVAARLEPPRAYTTVMTTLDRLYKRGLLERETAGRAFRYRARWSETEWQRRQADELVEHYLTGRGNATPELLLSSLVEALEAREGNLLEELAHRLATRKRASKNPRRKKTAAERKAAP